jgi:hypothetical protein
MTEAPRGPRDWEPSDPDSQWWNPRPGDAYGPSDQERRQPWERPPPIRRFGGDPAPGLPPAPVERSPSRLATDQPPATAAPPPPQSPWYELLRGLATLVVAVAVVGGGVAVFIGSWRSVAIVVVAVAVAAGIELAILGAAASLRHAWPPRARPVPIRIVVTGVLVAALAPAPAGLALLSRDQRWSPGGWLAVAGIVLALLIRTLAAALRRPSPPAPAQRAGGVAMVMGLSGWFLFLIGSGCLVAPAAIQQFVFDDPLSDAGTPIGVPPAAIPTPSWSPPPAGDGGDPAAAIRHDLESRVLVSAGVAGPVASECFRAFEQPEFVCTVTYQGVDVQFAVETWVVGGDSYDYFAEAFETVLTEEGLHAQLRQLYGDYEDLRCDELPAVELVRVDEQLPQRCYGKPSRFDRTEEIAIVPRQPGHPSTFVLDPD